MVIFFERSVNLDFRDRCCNPFNLTEHKVKGTQLKSVTHFLINKLPILKTGQKICTSCRLRIGKVPEQSRPSSEDQNVDPVCLFDVNILPDEKI